MFLDILSTLWRKERNIMSKFVIRTVASGIKSDLKHTNGQVIATSEGYKAKASCLNGIDSVRRNAPDAEVVQ